MSEYDRLAARTAQRDYGDLPVRTYNFMALAGEAGEAANEEKKVWRDDLGTVTPERRKKMLYELGDCLWYISRCANSLDSDLAEVARLNITKLADRHHLPAETSDASAS